MGYFVSILRERIANFEAPAGERPARAASRSTPRSSAASRSTTCARTCATSTSTWTRSAASSAARYGITLDASLITGIDPPPEVESALAAINTAHNHVSSEISLAQAGADQKIVQSRRAVEIETLKAQARGRAAAAARGAAQRAQGQRPGRAGGLPAQRAPRPLQPGARRDPGGRAMIEAFIEFAAGGAHHVRRHVPADAGRHVPGARARPLRDRARAHVPRLRALRQGRRHHRRAGAALPAVQARAGGVPRQLAGTAATSSTCASTRSTCAASRSTRRKARRWASASGTRCTSAIRWRTCSRTPIRAARCAPTSATPRCAA